MREIKIRVFDTKTKEMLYFHPLTMTEEGASIAAHQANADQYDWIDTWTGRPDDRYIFMEGTGLKDRDEKEIYEGDLIKGTGKPMIIVFDNGCFVAKEKRYSRNWTDLRIWDDDISRARGITIWEKVGNIYENPKLINQ